MKLLVKLMKEKNLKPMFLELKKSFKKLLQHQDQEIIISEGIIQKDIELHRLSRNEKI